ncbi:hypothetical protein [Desulfatibacillum aliphaticivorans]|uniref:hypothetical protein n=1 Tax=Desulfatibacillum aliphaticivorans TaxID=218208 RepID=UPI000418F0F0|nr:hypothetical protein [Desulfatibacillum aliphaticivorans]
MNAQKIVQTMLENKKPNLLMTDGYKFAMGQAGFPLRKETFYLSFRRPGWYFIPFDLARAVRAMIPPAPAAKEEAYLAEAGYGLTPAMKKALEAEPEIHAAPRGSWVREREPILTVTGPSFLVSWLEPLVIWLQYPIQIAAEALLAKRRDFTCTCEDEAIIAGLTLEACGVFNPVIQVDRKYKERVLVNARALSKAVSGQGRRLFEVGMRGATCMSMHRLALEACQEAGLTQTSDVCLARELGMVPVGTAGHEHQQRWGSDQAGFRAIRDMRPQAPSYLFDTYDAVRTGIPAAIAVMRENPDQPCSVRFDSGDQKEQLRRFVKAGVNPAYVFMDSMDADKVRGLEEFAEKLGVPPERRFYGAGGYLVGRPALDDLTRDRVSAVYKLSQTAGEPVMKFSAPEKTTVPGVPMIFRRNGGRGEIGLIGQAGEDFPEGYGPLKSSELPAEPDLAPVGFSRATAERMEFLRRRQMPGLSA